MRRRREIKINLKDYNQEEIKRIANHFEILFEMDYALPNSKIQESENGYVFFDKQNKRIELNTEAAIGLLKQFKAEIL